MAAAFSVITFTPIKKTVYFTDTTIYEDTVAIETIVKIVEAFLSLWKDIDNVTNVLENQWMEIPLVDNWQEIYKVGQIRVYLVDIRDKEVIDKVFDKLHKQGRIKWTTISTLFSFPCFVVWRETANNSKGRVVIDIRALNKITVSNAYPVSMQSEILALLRNVTYISTIDVVVFFY